MQGGDVGAQRLAKALHGGCLRTLNISGNSLTRTGITAFLEHCSGVTHLSMAFCKGVDDSIVLSMLKVCTKAICWRRSFDDATAEAEALAVPGH